MRYRFNSGNSTAMNQILIDSIASLSVHNGVLRIACMAAGADGQLQPSGTLVIPGATAAQVLNALIKGTQELDKKLREQQGQATGNA
jgi:hypothetical protein